MKNKACEKNLSQGQRRKKKGVDVSCDPPGAGNGGELC